jgi:phospholipase/carboxylesterase
MREEGELVGSPSLQTGTGVRSRSKNAPHWRNRHRQSGYSPARVPDLDDVAPGHGDHDVAIATPRRPKAILMNRGRRLPLLPAPGMSRRAFVKVGLAVAAAPALARCSDGTGPLSTPKLSAQPGAPTETPTLGVSALGLGGSRDGVLYVPQSYSPDTPMPLFVGLHGAGGQASFWASYYARAETRGMVFMAPDSRDYTWDLVLGGFGPDVAFLDKALSYVFARCRIDPAHVVLGGFSDGASYALSLGVCNGDLFSHLIAYSPGFYAPGRPIVGHPPIFISHGTEDTVLPFTNTRDVLVPQLRGAGYDVTFHEFAGPHGVPADVSETALDWFLAAP